MPHHHCCILGCRSDSRYSPRDASEPLKFFCVPSVTSKKTLHTQWLAQIGRPDLIVSRNTRVCSRHFVDGRPTKENALPMLRLECYPYKRSRVHNTARPYPKDRIVEDLDEALNQSALKYKSSPSWSPTSNGVNDSESSQYNQYNYYDDDDEIGVEIPETVIHEYKQTQTEASQVNRATQTTGSPCLPRVLWDSTCHCCKSSGKAGYYLNRPELLCAEPFSVDSLKQNEEMLLFYAGVATHTAFYTLLEELRPKILRRSQPCDENVCGLSLADQLLMVLMAQRLGLIPQDLAYRFHVTCKVVESVCSKWRPLLERHHRLLR